MKKVKSDKNIKEAKKKKNNNSLKKVRVKTPVENSQIQQEKHIKKAINNYIKRIINHILKKYIDRIVVVYLDDILIFNKILKEHKEHIHLILTALKQANLYINIYKSIFYN